MALDVHGGNALADLGLIRELSEEEKIDATRTVRRYVERVDAYDDLEILLEMLDLV